MQSKSIEALESGNDILRDLSNKLDHALNRQVEVIDNSLSTFNKQIEKLISTVSKIVPPGEQQVLQEEVKREEEDYDYENIRYCPGDGDSDCECMGEVL